MTARRTSALAPLCTISLLLTAGCSTWHAQQRFDGWTLHAQSGRPVDADRYRAAFEPAFAVVERELGPFRESVDVYAWRDRPTADSPDAPHATGAEIEAGEAGLVEEIPGIGPARVRAYHARGRGWFGPSTGVYIESAETGTAVHELVHARLSQERASVPLWLEEGLACLLGDGYQGEESWVVDGLACWPLRELGEQKLASDEIAPLLRLRADDETSSRDNVLVHFVGWAIVFDLYRESGAVDWQSWSQRYGRSIDVDEASERIDRTLAAETLQVWLARLLDPDPEVRLATAKGLWKLHSAAAVDALLDALEEEEHPTVRVGFAINALAAAGEVTLPRPMIGRLWRTVWPTLRRAKLSDPVEQAAVAGLFRSLRSGAGGRSSEPALAQLKRYWSE